MIIVSFNLCWLPLRILTFFEIERPYYINNHSYDFSLKKTSYYKADIFYLFFIPSRKKSDSSFYTYIFLVADWLAFSHFSHNPFVYGFLSVNIIFV
jgi:hypothetical protein